MKKETLKKTKRILAFLLAVALLISAVRANGLYVRAEDPGTDPVTLTAADFTVATGLVYTGEELSPVSVSYSPEDGQTYTVALSDDNGDAESIKNAGTYTVIVTDSDNSVIINQKIVVEYTNSSSGNVECVKDAGTYSIKIREDGNTESELYSGSVTVSSLNLSDGDVSSYITIDVAAENVPWTADLPQVSVKYKEVVLNQNDYTFEVYKTETSEKITSIIENGAYDVKIIASANGNLSGDKTVSNAFRVEYDTAITNEKFDIEGIYPKEMGESVTYYYKSNDNVKITAKESYELKSVSENTSVEDKKTLKLTPSFNGEKIEFFVINVTEESKSGNKFEVMPLTKDTTPPEISIVENYENPYEVDGVVKWVSGYTDTNKPILTVKATDDESGCEKIYYTDADNVTDIIEMREYTGETTLNEGNTYYFVAVDNVGNESEKKEVYIPKVDSTFPSITVKDGDVPINNGSSIYLKADSLNDERKKVFTVTYFDNESGIKEENLEENLKTTFSPSNSSDGECKTLTQTVSDNVGNESTHSTNIYYDPIVPSIEEIKISKDGGENIVAYSEPVLTNQAVTVYAKVTDQTINDQDQLKKVCLVTEEGDSATEFQMEPLEGKDDYYYYTFSKENYVCGNYWIDAYDNAGNKARSNAIKIEIIPSLSFDSSNIKCYYIDDQSGQSNHTYTPGTWTNKNVTFETKFELPKGSGATIQMFYKKAGDENWTEIENPTVQEEDNKKIFVFQFTEKDDLYDGKYYFYAKDTAGNEVGTSENTAVSIDLKKDIKAPTTTDIYVQYKSDMDENTLLEKFVNTMKTFFYKEKVTVDLYIHDDISGVASIEYKYNGQNYTTDGDAVKGYYYIIDNELTSKDNVEEDSANLEYTHIQLILKGNKDIEDTLTITKIVDNAGNEVKNPEGNMENLSGKTLLVIDKTAPQITASVTGENATLGQNGTYFSKADSVTVQLEIDEKYFGNGEQKPVVNVSPGTVNINGTEKTIEIPDVWDEGIDGKYVASIVLPKVPNEETVYAITVSYKDPSGNTLVDSNGSKLVDASGNNTDTYKTEVVLDDKAPQFTDFAITTAAVTSESNVYSNNVDGNDIRFEGTINDAYWDVSNLKINVIDATGNLVEEIKQEDIGIRKSGASNDYTFSFEFDGEKNVAKEYKVVVSYTDRAGNNMVSGNTSLSVNDNGTYTSPSFILDHVAPVFSITYNNAHRLVKNDDSSASADIMGAAPQNDYTAYYGAKEGKIEAEIAIEEKYADYDSENKTLSNVRVYLTKEQADSNQAENVTWEKSDDRYTARVLLDKDGKYNISVTYTDKAGNLLTWTQSKDSNKTGTLASGTYTSADLVLDTKAPDVQYTYSSATSNTNGSKQYFNKAVNLNITVEDDNIRRHEYKEVLNSGIKAYTVTGEAVSGTALHQFVAGLDPKQIVNGTSTLTLPLSQEAYYEIPMEFVDLAGNKTTLDKQYACVDTSLPKDLQFSYAVTDSGFLDFLNYKDLGFAFADKKLEVTVSGKDDISGIKDIIVDVTDENNTTKTFTKTYEASSSRDYTIAVPLEGSDFKGSIKVTVVDYAVNSNSTSQGQIVESGDKHSSTGSAVITTKTSPSRTVNGVDYYNTDVVLNLKLEDTYSGLYSYEYAAGSEIKGDYNYAADADNSAITNVFATDLTISASANNSNNVPVNASFKDNAGHKSSVEAFYNIDIVAPTIEVTYDNNHPSNEKYYKDTRTATVVITERNFDPSDVDLKITNTDGVMPAISGWTTTGSGDAAKHTATVTFSADGDYTFTVVYQDFAGNKASYNRVDEFTIDKTKPEYTVSYDNNLAQNEYYYDATRTATIDITEHNFDPSKVSVQITKDGSSAGVPSVSGWSRNGDHNIATINYAADAEYTFTISGVDLADNAMDTYVTDHFVVDTEAPSIEIFDIENMSANNGVVRPGIRYNDTNYDANATVVEMTGYHNGKVEMDGSTTTTGTGVEIKLNDFEHVQEMDDLYTMKATVYDLAGNSSESEVVFSVNRFGSVYTFDEATDALVGDNGRYYTNEEQDIVVVETNVDSLEFKEITCNLNGELKTLTEGEDYQIEESGSDVSWKQYTYTLGKELFENEGTYTITIYSEDKALNTSDNNSKGKKIEFVVDKTKPSIVVSGVENEGQYREDSREVTIDVDDNVCLSGMEIMVDGTPKEYTAQEVSEADGKITLALGSKNSWQTLSVTARDAAGNVNVSDDIRYLITSNFFIQFAANTPLVVGTVAGVSAVAGGVYYSIFRLRRRKKLI